MDQHTTPSDGLSGAVDQLVDLIEFFCVAQMDSTFRIVFGAEHGAIHVRSGQVAHAETGELRGEEAFYAMLQWQGASFETCPLEESVVATIEVPWESLLLAVKQASPKEAETTEESDEALYQRVQKMKVPEKIHLAMTGDKEVRNLLSRDSNRTVQYAVICNPRITDTEVATIANSRSVDDEVIRKIAGTREWLKAYPVRLALAMNPKTPLPVSMRMVSTLMARDLRQIARSKSVPGTVAQAARKLLATRT